MTLPSSGTISMGDAAGANRSVFHEKVGRSADEVGARNISLKGLSVNGIADFDDEDGDDVDVTGTPNSSSPYGLKEFYGYSQFSWSTSTVYAPVNYFTSTAINVYSNTAVAGTSVKVTWNSNNSHTVQFGDFTGSLNVNTQSYSSAQTFTSSVNPSSLQVRWLFSNYDRVISSYADSGDDLDVNFHSQNAQVFNGTSSSANNQTYTSAWQSVTPFNFSGNNSNVQYSYIRATASGGGSDEDGQEDIIKIDTDSSSQYVGLQYRANNDNNQIITFRNSLSTNVLIQAQSYYIDMSFSCIMPDMLVLRKVVIDDREHNEWTRIGDIQVGDYILAQGDLNDTDVLPQWAEVRETRTHTRSGYWDVGGIHITNDHPVWLTDDTHSAWVKVEDMRDGIERTYVEGSCDPVYLETTPGHFYVWNKDKETPLTVSGSYAPQIG